MKNKTLWLIGGLMALIVVLKLPGLINPKPDQPFVNSDLPKINGLMLLIETQQIEGVLQWEKELDQRGLTTLINVKAELLEEHPEVFKRLVNKGWEIAGHAGGHSPFWDMPYEEQYKNIKEIKEKVESITGKKMRVVNSTYFAYDENTLKVAEELGIEYVLGRGVRDIEATIFKPDEYNVKIISVSNVDIGEPMGRGSLCDYSLWARGADPEEFGQMINNSIAKMPTNMILVSHAHIGGTRIAWWNEYKKALANQQVSWKGLNDWLNQQEIINMPNADIPMNIEVKYGTPTPVQAVEDYEPISGLEFCEINSDNEGLMICQ